MLWRRQRDWPCFPERVGASPGIIFGSKDERTYGEYATAWALLYHRFQLAGVTKDAAKHALKQINATIGNTFVYRRWDSAKKKFLSYPPDTVKYAVRKVSVQYAPQRGKESPARYYS